MSTAHKGSTRVGVSVYRQWDIYDYHATGQRAFHATKGGRITTRLRHHLRAETMADMRTQIDQYWVWRYLTDNAAEATR